MKQHFLIAPFLLALFLFQFVNATGAYNMPVTYTTHGDLRKAGTTTIGVYESAVDVIGPAILYATLANTLCLTDFTLSASITDSSGVNTSPGTKPRLYFKKSSDANTYAGNASANNGWKYVEANNSTSPFSFTSDYSLLQSAIATGDIIQYFLVSQEEIIQLLLLLIL